jgi:hypothetical protein
MTLKQAGCLISLLILSGCAATGPSGTAGQDTKHPVSAEEDRNHLSDGKVAIQTPRSAETPLTARSTDLTHTNRPAAGATLSAHPSETASTNFTREPNSITGVNEMEILTLPQLLYRLDRFTTLDPMGKKERLQQMENRFTQLNPADRYEFVLLLARKGNSNKLLSRLISILDELEGHVKDQIVLEILNLHRRYFKLQQQYSQERSKTIELNKKIERLKGLEQDLDKSNTRIQESLKPVP